jgi:phospholipase/carboxylesterase
MNLGTETFGGLSCQVVDALPKGKSPERIVVLCHGFGAPGTDLVPLGPELLHLAPSLTESLQFIFPAAPLSLDEFGMHGGRAWWHIDIEQLNRAVMFGEFRNLRNDMPAGLVEARQMLTELIDTVSKQRGLPHSAFVLGGFSQGSMLSTDVALRMPTAPAGLCILSGTLLCEDQWRELAANRGPLRVLQSHGRQDTIMPYRAAEWLRDMLVEAGLEVEFIPFNGPHTIPLEALHRFAEMLEESAE